MTFGKRIAEEEQKELRSYFVETNLWRRILADEVDVVYGAKGSGKSAIYSLLLDRTEEFAAKRLHLVAAESVRGATVFSTLSADPPTSEQEFIALWKLYFLSLAGSILKARDMRDPNATDVVNVLSRAGLIGKSLDLSVLLRAVLDYARGGLRPKTVEGEVRFDPGTGLATGFAGKITFREPTEEARRQGVVSADELFRKVDKALGRSADRIWILLDRLDVAFADSPDLERNALRALFRVYLNLNGLDNLRLKIFLRSDIWKRISDEGFREASHITRSATIEWNHTSLMNLVIRRALRNDIVRSAYGVDATATLAEVLKQQALFYRIFPDQVESGPRKSKTFDWMLSHTRDGTDTNTPRELIHLLEETRQGQLAQFDVGEPDPPGEALFGPSAIKTALRAVSVARLNQTLYAEYPKYKPYLEKLDAAKTQQTVSTLAALWDIEDDAAAKVASELVDVGFFQRRGSKEQPEYWVPFLYRGGLNLVQGSAEDE